MAKNSPRRDWFFAWFFSVAVVIVSVMIGIFAFNFFWLKTDRPNEPIADGSEIFENENIVPFAPVFGFDDLTLGLPARIDFQSNVEKWASAISGKKSVMIYDLERDQVAASLNVRQNYWMASIYKIFLAYEGYRRIEKGVWRSEDRVAGKTRGQCLDLMLRESNSICAEAMFVEIGRTNFDKIVANDFGIKKSKISELNSNVEDVSKLMKLIYARVGLSEKTVVKMKDAMLNQPCVNSEMCVGGCCDWRQGLPRGFSKRVRVYNKVGWNWNGEAWDVYHDAAIVEFVESKRHFVVVVMANGVVSWQIAELGRAIEAAFLLLVARDSIVKRIDLWTG